MSDTPRTDSAAIALHGTRLAPGCIYVESSFARELERELFDMQRRCQTAINHYETAAMRAGELEEQRDTLAEALKYTVKRVGECERPWRKRWDEAMVVVNKALAAVKGVES